MSAVLAKAKPKSRADNASSVSSHTKHGGDRAARQALSPPGRLGAFYSAGPPFSLGAPVQAKLEVGSPDDAYEKEADQVAEIVMRRPLADAAASPDDDEEKQVQTKPLVQRQAAPEEPLEEEPDALVQTKPLIQRQEDVEEEPGVLAQTKPVVQRMCAECQDEGEGAVQRQSASEELIEEEEPSALAQTKPLIQRQEDLEEEGEEDKPLQTKPIIQRQEAPEEPFEEEPDALAQTKPLVQRQEEMREEAPAEELLEKPSGAAQRKAEGSSTGAVQSAASSIASPGPGAPLSPRVRERVELVLGADLSHVQVHTDHQAHEASQSLKARAFTHKNHIWLGSNESPQDVELMAHEATHVLQQDGLAHRKPVSEQDDQEENREEEGVEIPSEERSVTTERATPERASEVPEARLSSAETAEATGMATSAETTPLSAAVAEDTTETQATPPPSEPDVAETSAEAVPLEEAPSEAQAAVETATEEPAAQSEEAEATVEGSGVVEGPVEEGQAAGMAQADSVVAQAEAEPLPSLVDLLGPIEEAPSAQSQEEDAETTNSESQPNTDMAFATGFGGEAGAEAGPETEPGPIIMRMPQSGSAETDSLVEDEYDPEAARAEVQSIWATITAASTETQQRIEMQAEDVRANLISNAETLRQSVQAQVAANVAFLRGAFATERASLEASLEAAHTQVTTALGARQAEAVAGGEAAKARLTNLFTQHRAAVETTVQDNVTAAEEMRAHYATEVHERTQAQATEARQRGRTKSSSYPATERGRLQADAALGVANETAQEIEARGPEAVEAIGEATVELPEQFQEQGQEALDGFDEGLPDLLDGVDQQVQAVTSALNEQATQAYQQLNTLGSQMREQLNALETAAVARTEALGLQVEAQIDGRLESVQVQIDTATPKAIGQVSQMGDEAVQVLLSLETPDAAASREFANQILAAMTGIADTAGDGLQQSGDQIADEFQLAEASASESLLEIEQQTTDELQTMRQATNTALSDLVAGVNESFGNAILSLEESFTETETQVEADLSQAVEELATDFDQALQDAEEEIINAVDEGLSKNDEALDQLAPQMQEAANDAAWDYDHPILSTLASIGAIIAGVIVGIVLLVLAVLAVILLVKGILFLVAGSAILTAIFKVVLVVGGLALVAYGVYEAYQARIEAGEEGGWATFGMALLDFAGITDLYRAITTPGLSPWERFELAAWGTFKLGMTLLLVYGALRFVRTGGLRNAWRGLWGSVRWLGRRLFRRGQRPPPARDPQRLSELQRLRELGTDPRSGQFRQGEADAASRLEQRVGRLRRDPSGDGDWIDAAGRTYDAVGPVPSGRFNAGSFNRSIDNHFLKQGLDHVVVDLAGLSPAELALVEAHIAGLSPAQQARIIIQ